MNASELTAVVLNWRTPVLTGRAVRALAGDGVPMERIVVVDNGSGAEGAEGDSGTEGVDALRVGLPEVRVLALDRNLGFARGNNRGAAALPGEAYLFVNSDAFVGRPGTIGHLLAALDDPRVGIAVPRLRNEDGSLQPSVVPISKPLSELIRASGLSRLVPNQLQPRFGTHWDHSETRPIESAVGAVLLVRGSAWEDLGGFDEQRFMYAEDHDLFRRAAERGWRSQFVAEAEFEHLGSASGEQRWSDPDRAELVARSEAAMVREHLSPFQARLTVALMSAGVAVRALVKRLRGDHAAARTLAGWLRGYRRR
jgi:GT2 family glycosyltransferase